MKLVFYANKVFGENDIPVYGKLRNYFNSF